MKAVHEDVYQAYGSNMTDHQALRSHDHSRAYWSQPASNVLNAFVVALGDTLNHVVYEKANEERTERA
jgi:hypothetical protein